jgi:hypothetical protein
LRLPVSSEALEALRQDSARDNRRRDRLTIAIFLLVTGVLYLGAMITPAWPGWLLALTGLSGFGWAWWRR